MRLIDADALEKTISVSHTMTDDYGIQTGYAICMRLIEDAPTIEPERKKGKWVCKERRESVYDLSGVKTWGIAYMCSECGFIHTVIEDFGQYVYCPNCGADMRYEDGRNDTNP